METRVDEILKKHEIGGAAIAVLRRGTVDFECRGMTSASSRVPVNPDTTFEVGSLSKPIFATAFLEWCIRSGFDPDRPVKSVYPLEYCLWNIDTSERKFSEITARMLLNHTSGFNNWDNWHGDDKRRLKSTPGAKFSYSGEGYVYLQKVFELLVERDLETFLRENFYSEAGLKNSSYVWKSQFEGNFAEGQGERNDGLGKFWTEPFSAYSLYSSAADLARFLSRLMDVDGPFRAVCQQDRFALPFTEFCSWGQGWGIEHGKGFDTFWHWGNLGDYHCFMAMSHELQDGILILTNSGNAQPAFAELTQHFLGRPLSCAQASFLKMIENHEFCR